MYYCFYEVSNLFKEEVEYAKSLGKYISYNEIKDKFFDKEGKEINIKNLIIFPRSTIQKSKRLIDAINKQQGISIIDKCDFDKTLNWPFYIKTKRNNIILSGRQILENKKLIRDIFGNNSLYFKTKEKNYSAIIPSTYLTEKDSLYLQAIENYQDDDFIITENIDIAKDEFGLLIYRAFIKEQEILNISRTYNCKEQIEKEIINRIKEINDILKETDFPKSYVIDMMIYKDKNENYIVDVLGCSPIIASTTYLCNSIFTKNKHLEYPTIPEEKTRYKFKPMSDIRTSIYYSLPNGFAEDIMSLSMYEEKILTKKLNKSK